MIYAWALICIAGFSFIFGMPEIAGMAIVGASLIGAQRAWPSPPSRGPGE